MNICPFYFWHSPIGLNVQSSPGQFHWFEYQIPIQSSSLGLFELHHAVRGRWVAESDRSWKYWLKILMEWSQSPSQPQPNAHVLFGYMSATFLLMCSCFRPKAEKLKCGAHSFTRRPQNRCEWDTTVNRPATAALLAANNWLCLRRSFQQGRASVSVASQSHHVKHKRLLQLLFNVFVNSLQNYELGHIQLYIRG